MGNLLNNLIQKNEKISVVGLGYVGLPLALRLARYFQVIGFDLSMEKINAYNKKYDPTGEVGRQDFEDIDIEYTNDENRLAQCKFHIVAVPTPIDKNKNPNLSAMKGASASVGRYLTKGSIVVYESTVYPGVTEDICLPILEKCSGLKAGIDFKIGYSPERINPGDKIHTVEKITKVVSGQDKESLQVISGVYKTIVEAGVYEAECIKVAEAAKVIENTQRDLNIALMNELAIIFNQMGIDTQAVLKAAGTKWNFLRFYPGLVGGHCIGVDPYYLTFKAEEMGYHPQIILAGRRINDNMGKFIAETTVKEMIRNNAHIKGSRILIMGLTFKEDVADIRNTKVTDIIHELNDYGVETLIYDPVADKKEVEEEYQLKLTDIQDIDALDAIIIAVSHQQFKDIALQTLKDKCKKNKTVLIDIKGIVDKHQALELGFNYWRL